jgi:hypothetical protein
MRADLHDGTQHRWTPADVSTLVRLWPTQSMGALARHFKVSRSALSGIIWRLRRRGINLPSKKAGLKLPGEMDRKGIRWWTEAEFANGSKES